MKRIFDASLDERKSVATSLIRKDKRSQDFLFSLLVSFHGEFHGIMNALRWNRPKPALESGRKVYDVFVVIVVFVVVFHIVVLVDPRNLPLKVWSKLGQYSIKYCCCCCYCCN